MAIASCWDDPTDVFEWHGCVLPLSKDVEGKLTNPDSVVRDCMDPGCKSLRWLSSADLRLSSHGCDHLDVKLFNGQLDFHRLATAFATDLPSSRGVHAGEFRWDMLPGLGIVAVGRISGITNAGNHRGPKFPSCEQCHHPGRMSGRLCGVVSEAPPTHGQWLNAMVNAMYLLEFDVGGGGGQLNGTLEGAITVRCMG